MNTDKHLMYEIKHELDWAANEVKRTEKEAMGLELEYSKAIENASEEDVKRLTTEREEFRERIGLHDAYTLQRRAAQRFYMLSHVYDIASANKSADVIREHLSGFMYRSIDGKPENADQKDKLLELAEALMAYFADGHSDEADEAIREAWQNIEETLRGLGRTV